MEAIKWLEGQKQIKRVKNAYRDIKAAEKAKGKRADAPALDEMMKSLQQDLKGPQPPSGVNTKKSRMMKRANTEVLNQIEEVNEEESSHNTDKEGSGSGKSSPR